MPTPSKGYVNKAGEPIPGCTTVLASISTSSNDALLGWAAKLAREGKDWRAQRQRSGDVGTHIHDLLESYPDCTMVRPPWMHDAEWDKVILAVAEYDAWFQKTKPTVIAKELHLVSETLQAGGTFDLVLQVGDYAVVADHKTGKTIDKAKIAAQLAMYGLAAEENGLVKGPIERGLILHYTDTGLRPIELSPEQMDHGRRLFRAARAAYGLIKTFPRG